MKAQMRKERGPLAVEWIRYGERQSAEMGGEELLSCRFYVMREGSWIDAGVGILATQVRAGEEEALLQTLLDKLLDRFEDLLPEIGAGERISAFREQLRWFGPEMAEEY